MIIGKGIVVVGSVGLLTLYLRDMPLGEPIYWHIMAFMVFGFLIQIVRKGQKP